jgi:hypothetical protein
MLLEGQELHAVVSITQNVIELRNEYGRLQKLISSQEALVISSQEALALDLGLFVGVGNRRRVRFLRSRTQKWNGGKRAAHAGLSLAGVFL